MRILLLGIISVFLTAPLFGGDTHSKMFQVAPFSSLMEGGYDSYYSIEDLSKEGDFGLGTFSNLDGEMVAYKGKYYHINQKGQVKEAKKNRGVPFAQVVQFEPDNIFDVKRIRNFKVMEEFLSDHIEMKNIPCAILIKGKFAYLKLSSLRPQKKPYCDLEAATEKQAIYHFEEVEGVAIGFWSPSYWGEMTGGGYRFNFISERLTRGGRILDMHLLEGKISIMPIQNIELYLPKKPSFQALELGRGK